MDLSRSGVDESVEKALLLRVDIRGVLGVPLHANDPFGTGPLDGFDDPVGTAAGDDETLSERIDSLVVEGKTSRRPLGAHGQCSAGSRNQLDRMSLSTVSG